MMLLPYRTNVPFDRLPVANFVIIGLAVLVFIGQLGGADVQPLVLDGWTLSGLFGYMWLHGGFIHILGNLWFLWLFGNAVCARVGNLTYASVYLTAGVAGAALHVLCDGAPAVGASAAINGVVGMYLILYPTAPVSCFYFVWLVRGGAGTFEPEAFWLILLWLVFDIWGAVMGSGGVAYWAHIGGFLCGALTAYVLVRTSVVKMAHYELSLVELLRPRDKRYKAKRASRPYTIG